MSETENTLQVTKKYSKTDLQLTKWINFNVGSRKKEVPQKAVLVDKIDMINVEISLICCKISLNFYFPF